MREHKTGNIGYVFTGKLCTLIVCVLAVLLLVLSAYNYTYAAEYEIGPGAAVIPKNVTMQNVDFSMMKASYWTSFPGADRVRMGSEEIRKLNAKNLADPDCNMYDLPNLPETFDGEKMKISLSGFADPKGLYLGRTPVTADLYENVRRNIRNARVSSNMQTRYGFCVKREIMRDIPYGTPLTDNPEDPEWDQLVLSPINLGDPVTAYVTTADGAYTYVRSTICGGWVPTDSIAICHSREEWEQDLDPEKFIVVTGSEIVTEDSLNNEHSNQCIEMGTVLELCDDPVEKIDYRLSWCNYVVYCPGRGADGYYEKHKMLIPFGSDVSIGYMKFTQKNLIEQAFKYLGKRYGWGGSMNSQDCSSYGREVYQCFGFCLPRNTTWQKAMKVNVTDITGMSYREKSDVFSALPAGSIIQFPGHEMIYLGEKNGKHYSINNVSSMGVDTENGIEVVRPRSVIVNCLEDTKRPNGKTWFDEMTATISVY